MLRDFLHHLVDGLIDDFETWWEESLSVQATVSPRAVAIASAKPRITLDVPAQKPTRAKPAPPPPRNSREVTVACRSNCNRLEIAINLSAPVAKRLGLKPLGKAIADLRGGKLRLHASKEGRSVYSAGRDSDRLFFVTLARAFGVTEKHPAEGCTFHYDLEDALLIEPPAWLTVGRPPSTKQTAKPKDGTPVSCKKMAGTNPTIKCSACQKATATVECSRCPTLLCDGCWETHVRKHWHTAITSKPPVGNVANLKG
jgi:hypothetical protein